MTGFIERYGHVPYKRLSVGGLAWKMPYIAKSACEMESCGATGQYGALVFDHCHQHMWIRGVLCGSCNNRVGRIEAVTKIPGVTVDLGDTVYARFLARCPGDDPAAIIPAAGVFAPAPLSVPRHVPVPGPAIARAESAVAHIADLAAATARTLCGRMADAMVASDALAICQLCSRGLAAAVAI